MTQQRAIRTFLYISHVLVWLLLLTYPLLLMGSNANVSWLMVRQNLVFMGLLTIPFYLNFFLLVPRWLLQGRWWPYLLLNLMLVMVFGFLITELQSWMKPPSELDTQVVFRWMYLLRNCFFTLMSVLISTALQLIMRWRIMERSKENAEQARTQAELDNLKAQLNPHFLLNTLNNIYALIAFDADKAQETVMQLSQLLRYVLYENQEVFVPLQREMDFMRNYVELMRVRYADNVRVETQFSPQPDSTTKIAPLLFISLVENAFKHGVSPTEPSHIQVRMTELQSGNVICEIRNTFFPKQSTDHSGSGIGLEQVRRRLALQYPGHHHWVSKVIRDEQGTQYFLSRITILTS